MGKLFNTRSFDLAITVAALSALTATPAWAVGEMPGPAAGLLAGGAIIGAIVIAKLWRRK